MADYSHIAGRRPAETAEVAIEGLDGMRPVLICRPATDANAAYFDAVLRRQRARGRSLSTKRLRRMRDDDRELIAAHCIVGWSGVVDVNGDAVPWSREEAAMFLRALPDSAFDALRDEIGDAVTFEDEPGNSRGS